MTYADLKLILDNAGPGDDTVILMECPETENFVPVTSVDAMESSTGQNVLVFTSRKEPLNG